MEAALTGIAAVSPSISVVMPLRNCADTVEQAVRSVLDQGVEAELIVIDGASDDGTLAVLERYRERFVVFRSRPDSGPLDAFEEGFALARGDIVMVLCGDDWLAPGSLAAIRQAFTAAPTLDVVSCGAAIDVFDASGRPVSRRTFDQPDQLGFAVTDILRLPMTGSRILTRGFYERVGAFDRRFPLATDLDYLLRAAVLRPNHTVLTRVVYHHRHHPRSRTMGESWTLKEPLYTENLAIAEARLADEGLSKVDRAALAAFHGDRAKWLAEGLAARGRWGDALAIACRATRMDPLWPLRFARHLAARLKGMPTS